MPKTNRYQAVILDMDGVIVDSEHQWLLAEEAFFRRILKRWSKTDNHKLVGVIVEDIHAMLAREHGLKMRRDEFVARCEKLARGIYTRRVNLTPGLRRFIREIERRGLPLGLASSSPAAWVDMVLDRFRLRRHFAAVVTGDDAPGRSKPAPDLYLIAAKRLKAPPGKCLAVEDSAVGVRAAKAAGMACVGLRSGLNDEQDLSAADCQARGFPELIRQNMISQLVLKKACG